MLLTVSVSVNNKFLACIYDFNLKAPSLGLWILEIFFELIPIKFNIIYDCEFFIQCNQSYFHSFDFNISFPYLELKLVYTQTALNFFSPRTI